MNQQQQYAVIPEGKGASSDGHVELHRIVGKRRFADIRDEEQGQVFNRIPSDDEEGDESGSLYQQPSKRAKCIEHDWKEDGRLDGVRRQMQSVL